MGEWIAHGAEEAHQQMREAFLLALLRFGGERTENQDRVLRRKRPVHQLGAIHGQARHGADALGDAFGRLEDGMEVVFIQQFGAAVVEHFDMDVAVFQCCLQPTGAGTRCVQGRGLVGITHAAIVAHEEARESQHHVQLIAPPSESARVARVVDWVHGKVDQQDQVIADLVLVLCFRERVEKALPLGDARRHIGDFDFLQQSLDLRARQTSFGVCKHPASCLHVLRTKGIDVSHGLNSPSA